MEDDGCDAGQRIAIECPEDSLARRGHYAACVARVAEELVAQGLLTKKDKARYITAAARKR